MPSVFSLSAYRSHASRLFIAAVVLFVATLVVPRLALAGTLLLSPTTGSFSVGSTFDVQILLDTQGKSVNALDVDVRFPPDKLQLVSPKTSVSVISVWTSQPIFNNQTGTIRLQGGIPRGVNVNNALVATLTFRVKAIGNAIVRFADGSKILLNDGLGTNDLSRQVDAVYTLVLPPPAGPAVASETHPLQTEWYQNSNVVLNWANDEDVQNYSYIFNDEPISTVDDVADGKRNQIGYTSVSDGRHYFHIKALRAGVWGGTTHFGVKVDTEPPAEFPLEFLPSRRSTVRAPLIKFATTDTLSGLDHYELKIVPRSPVKSTDASGGNTVGDQPFYVEVESPYIVPSLDIGSYDLFLRAYDKAGNYREVTERLTITDGWFGFSSSEGLVLGSLVIGWGWILAFLLSLVAFLWYYGRRVKARHDEVVSAQTNQVLPDDVRQQLEELKRFKSKYGAMAIIALLLFSGVFGSSGQQAYAEIATESSPIVELSPPYVTTVSKDVSNSEIFYIGGKTENKDTTVTIYTQNLTTGETTSFVVRSDKRGEWFYRHNSFLSPGKYVLWTQAKIGDIQSPPSPQIEMNVARAALVFGVTRISYESLYLSVTGLLIIIISYLVFFILYHARHQRRKKALVLREVKEAEESIKRGFAVLRRDIEQEISTVRKIGLARPMTDEERRHEDELLNDLKDIERRVGKEVWDVERVEAAA